MKKYLFGIFAVILAISATAFTSPKNVDNDVFYWYALNGTLLSETPSELPPNGCDEGIDPCAYGHAQMTSTPGVGANKIARFP